MAGTNMKFPDPHEIPTIPGTEGWERMYPYHYLFTTDDPERKAYEKGMFWFNDALHYPEPMYPFDIIWDEAWFLALSQNNTRVFIVPPALGVDHRIVNGNIYITPVPVADPSTIPARVELFMKRAGYYYQNWDRLHDNWEKKMREVIERVAAIEISDLPEMEEESVVMEGLGISSGYKLLKKYDDLIDLGILAWQYHFEFLNLGYAAYVVFLDFCQKAFPDIPIQRVTQMVSGVDVIMYQPDEELKKLAKLAMELGLADAILGGGMIDQLWPKLEATEAGKKWTAAFDKAKDPWFYISTGTGWYHHDSCWLDDLNIPLDSIRIYIGTLKKGGTIERPLADVREERDKITTEYRKLLKTDEDRATFDQLLGTSKTVFPYVENHLFYVEHWFHSIFWKQMRKISSILVNHGFIQDVEDIWYLSRSEIKDALWDLVTGWATGTKARGPLYWPKEIAWRKGVMDKFRQWTAPPALGIAPESITEPFTIVLWGVTSESMTNWAKAKEVGDLSTLTELKGFPGSPGQVEGPARVCRSVTEINQLQEGEILVAPTTSPSWAPAFQKIKACVTDVGGVMCHAAIVCREYGVPAIVGTGLGTQAIKTGDYIKVDGSTGVITIRR